MFRLVLVYNKNTSVKKVKATSSTLTNTKYLKECCKRYRVTFLKKTNLKKSKKNKIEKMLLARAAEQILNLIRVLNKF